MKQLKLFILFLAFLPIAAFADSFDDIMNAMRAGNAKELASSFNNSVELTLLENEGIYSKQQAEQMLKNFFAKNPPKSVSIQHKGASGQGAQYAIATYEAATGKFRAYMFLKDTGNGLLVHEFRIERQ
ncbi:MAG: DUF4783 domain-containing protein [Bacteroidia bacterium]